MKYIIVLLLLFSQTVKSECSKDFTTEQWNILITAYEMGKPHDLGLTTAAIIWQESFVGNYVVRMNTLDGNGEGSFGVGHMRLSTAMELLGITDKWQGKAELAPYLIRDDAFAIKMTLLYLQKMQKRVKGFRNLWRAYNGGYGGITNDLTIPYADSILQKVKVLRQCLEE